MITIGKINTLKVRSISDSGQILQSDSGEQAFLSFAMTKGTYVIGDDITVFLYTDNEGEVLASETLPHAIVGEYARMRVVASPEFGAFFEWGIDKDLLVPGNEQKVKVRDHEFHTVRVCLEEGTNRVFGTTKLGQFVAEDAKKFKVDQEVEIEPVLETDLGFKCIINKIAIGMVYHNEIFKEIEEGEAYTGVVKKIRDDGLIDVSFQKQGISNLTSAKDVILNFLDENDGATHLHDKSSPDEIKHYLGMSKKSFKNAVGMLYKDRKIEVSKEGIKLVK